jgi:N utilization substance protein A
MTVKKKKIDENERRNALIESFSEFKEFKHIDKPTTIRVLEDVFRAMLKKKYGSDDHFDVIVNSEKGDVEIWHTRTIVEDDDTEALADANNISLTAARKIEKDFEVGEEVSEFVQFDDFGRRSILAARQTLMQRIMELEKDNLFKKYKDRIGELINGEVYQVFRREMLVLDDEGNELLLPFAEQIQGDHYKKGDSIRAVVARVDMMNNKPKIVISRTSPLLERLLELEVPEIFEGTITIKKIVRLPGERAKVAVESFDDKVDPVGACVGVKGARIHGIVRELRNESIDVINFTNNTQLYITRALNPAKITNMVFDHEKKHAEVYLKPDQISLAIGKNGQNIKLAAKLTAYEIDMFRDNEEGEFDVDLEEFNDEIETWIIEELKVIGCDTAKSVLELGKDELVRRTDLEEETIEAILQILKAEFE